MRKRIRVGLNDDWYGELDSLRDSLEEDLKDKVGMPLTKGILGDDLHKYSIADIPDYLAKKELLERKGVLKYSTANELRLEDRNRLNEPTVLLQRRYIDCGKVVFPNSSVIKIINTIMNGDIFIYTKGRNVDVYLDNSIVLGKIVVRDISTKCDIVVVDSVISEMLIYRNKIGKFQVYSSRIFYCDVSENIVLNPSMVRNYIRYFLFYDNQYDSIVFHYSQLHKDYLKIPQDMQDKLYRRECKKFNAFKFAEKASEERINYDANDLKKVKTLDFLMQDCQTKSNRAFYSSLKTNMGYYSQQHFLGKLLMKVLKSLVSPMRIAVLLVLVYLLFSAMYTLPVFTFRVYNDVHYGLSLVDSLYFSGITLLTIGYGDIVPQGASRILSILEGLSGVVIAGGFLLSLVRKYLE